MALEAQKQKITKKKLLEYHVNSKCREVTDDEFNQYIEQMKITNVDTNSIYNYLLLLHQKERQKQYVDSLMQFYPVKVKLQPPFYREINTSQFYSQELTKKKENAIDVLVISDFSCTSCQKAEKTLKNLYEKYTDRVNFKFVYFSDYIDKSVLASEAAAKQNKFKQMHDMIFEHAALLHQDAIYVNLAKKTGLDLEKFNEDMADKQILKKLLKNKNLLINNNIYSTPTYIVNGKVLSDKYAIDYLEDVIIEEIKLR